MTAPAIASVIAKPYQYLDKFMKLMREGAEVPFTDEQVATRKIYKDGERVKKILSVLDDLIETGVDVNDPTILYDIFREEGGSHPYRKIEFQSITDDRNIETLVITKIGKQIISGRGGKKDSFPGKESDYTESLQCVALALRQENNSDITEEQFKEFLLKGRNEDTQTLRILKANVKTEKPFVKIFQYGLENPEWIKSCVNVSNALYKSEYFKSGIKYDFYHAGAKEIEWFKSKFRNKFNQVLANALRQQGYASGDSGEDKWNPADMFAIAKQINGQKVERETTTRDFFKGTIKEYAKFKRGKSSIVATSEKIQENMAELTRYNNWIHQNILSGQFIPISLKKTLNTPKIDLISNPSLEQYDIDVDNIKVTWEKTAQKIYIHFDVNYTFIIGTKKEIKKKTTSYFFDCRNFGMGTNVQFELGIAGSSAKHGKVSVGPAEMIIDLTSSAFGTMLKQTRKNFLTLINTPLKRTKIFPSLTSAPSAKVLDSFEKNIIDKNKPSIFTTNDDINSIVSNSGWPAVLSNYIFFLSKEDGYKIPKTENDMKNYFKSKIAAVELGWMMTSKKILPTLKSNILKSLYLYASSQGLQIFGDSGMLDKSYFYNSSYVKVRD